MDLVSPLIDSKSEIEGNRKHLGSTTRELEFKFGYLSREVVRIVPKSESLAGKQNRKAKRNW